MRRCAKKARASIVRARFHDACAWGKGRPCSGGVHSFHQRAPKSTAREHAKRPKRVASYNVARGGARGAESKALALRPR